MLYKREARQERCPSQTKEKKRMNHFSSQKAVKATYDIFIIQFLAFHIKSTLAYSCIRNENSKTINENELKR